MLLAAAVGEPSDSAAARRLWLAALDRRAVFDSDSAIVLLRAARRTAPAFYAAQAAYMDEMRDRGALLALRREYATRPVRDAVLAKCLELWAAERSAHSLARALEAERRYGATGCLVLRLAQVLPVRDSASRARSLDLWASAVRYAPELPQVLVPYARLLIAVGREREADSVLAEALRRAPHPYFRITLLLAIARRHLEKGDTARAVALHSALAEAVKRDGRPGLQVALLLQLDGYPLPSDHVGPTGRGRAAQRLAQRHGAWFAEWRAVLHVGGALLDRGDPGAAVAVFTRGVRIADSVGSPEIRTEMYLRRGRALVKAGRPLEGESDLRRALAASSALADEYTTADIYHNLAHAYEHAGRWGAAAAAADQFIRHADAYRGDPIRLMSYYDAGLIRRKAGWHAAAAVAFENMVRIVDERQANHYWAGEHYERQGDLQRALRYYSRGAALNDERSRNLAGLTRVYLELGLADRALESARAHDELTLTPAETPQLPEVLARQGRRAEAVRIARAWSDRQLANRNMEGSTTALLQLARLLLEDGRPREAHSVATQAVSLATRFNFPSELVEALRLRGVAAAGIGDHADGVADLSRALRVARSRGSADGRLRTETALGDVLAARARIRQALTAYDHAARLSDSMARRFDDDLDRSRYRDQHLAPFDGAVRLLLARALRRPSARTVDSLLVWSQRRKAAALAWASGHHGAPDALPVGLSELQRRLVAGEVLLDYIVVDGTAGVLAVSRTGWRVARLPVGGDSLARLVRRLNAPFTAYGGRIDLARSRYDVRAAHALYAAVLGPVASFLPSSGTLLVVPDRMLHHAPFDALVSHLPPAASANEYLEARYVIDRFAISLAPSAALARGRSPAAPSGRDRGDILLVTRDAPGAADEAAAILRAWRGGRVTVLSSARATESAVLSAAPRHTILHVAAHAEANDRDPLASHLRLAADRQADGFVHLAEIAARRWSNELIVLSGCETAAGPLLNGEGLIGLARSFLAGGADAVIATRWPVGAASAQLMGALYLELSRGAPVGDALREAKLTLRRRAATAHPFYWAGYLLVSRGGAAPIPSSPVAGASFR